MKKNWTGQKFFKLTFLNPSGNKQKNKLLWYAICECGKITEIIPTNVHRGNTKSCGECDRPNQSKDWTNIKFWSLTFIKPYKKTKNEQVIWEAICDCGNVINTLPCNRAKSCGCLAKPASKERCSKLGKAGRKFPPIISSARHIWRAYKRDGNIDFNTFYELSQLNCHWCGKPPSNQFSLKTKDYKLNPDGLFIYNGLDRIDSNRGHDIDNVVPSCIDCNIAKGVKTSEEFLIHIQRIYNHNF